MRQHSRIESGAGPGDDAVEPVSPAGRRLLSLARDVAQNDARRSQEAGQRSLLSDFVQIYREWISTSRGRSGTQQQQAERWRLVLHAMVTADTVGDAIGLLIRFGKVIWGRRGPRALRIDGETAALVFSEPYRPGPEGLVGSIWLLALTLCELEFLAGANCDGASGRVPHPHCLPGGIVRLLFDAPVAFEAAEVALLIPRQFLHRPVVAKPHDLASFFRQLLPLTLGMRRQPTDLASAVGSLIRDDKRGPDVRASSLSDIAARLGTSPSTLRRHLGHEGTGYRALREGVYNGLAQAWLRQPGISIGEIAVRLEFSDGFAFRRFFRRMNGVSPSVFRQQHAATAAPSS